MKHRFVTRALLLWLFACSCHAGVVVKENTSPGATNWPGSPVFSTLSNPSSASVIESFNGGTGGNTNLSQTFTVTGGNFTLQTISLYAGGGTGTGWGTNLVLRMLDLGTQTAPNPSPYTSSILGGDFFGGGVGLSVTYSNQANGILEFDFTGSDQLTLSNGHMYAFELTGVLNSTPVFWSRGTNDTYSGGAAYRNQAWINANNARDFALAVYAGTASQTNYPQVPDGIVYHIFTQPVGGINSDGANPAAGLALFGGVLCGTTENGGSQGAGTAFYLNPDASGFNLIHNFSNPPDANYPQGDFAVSGSRLFGTSLGGGTNGTGALFVAQTNGSVSLIRSFAKASADNATNSGGASPCALLASSGSALFGTTIAGGAFANGAVFSIFTNGSSFTTLHDFGLLDSVTGTNSDGAIPWSGLIVSGNTLFGTASAGGAGGSGVVFSINTNGGNFSVLHNFSPLDSLAATNSDGAVPFGGLVLSSNTLFGTTSAGGQDGHGTIFSIQTNGLAFTVLHHFSATDPVTETNTDGAAPCAALILLANVLYGTAPAGGVGGSGAIYSVKTDGSQFQTLYSFSAINASSGTNADGAFPVAGLLPLGNALYGTAFGAGPGAAGAVFSLPLPVPPAVITSIVSHPNGSITLSFLGGPNTTNIIQSTTNLAPPTAWQNISTNVADGGGAWQFTDPSATNSARFYRSYAH